MGLRPAGLGPVCDRFAAMNDKSKASEAPSFEQALEQLEQLVERLEDGQIPLEDSLKDFEKGVALVRQLRERLDQAQQRVEKIMETEGGKLEAQPMDFEED